MSIVLSGQVAWLSARQREITLAPTGQPFPRFHGALYRLPRAPPAGQPWVRATARESAGSALDRQLDEHQEPPQTEPVGAALPAQWHPFNHLQRVRPGVKPLAPPCPSQRQSKVPVSGYPPASAAS